MTVSLPIIDFNDRSVEQCVKAQEALHKYGALLIRDPRVTEEHNEKFLSMMERYFDQSTELKMKDVRPEFSYQVGATPELTETPKCAFDADCLEVIEKLSDDNKPHIPTSADPKWRYFWRIGERPTQTSFPELNADDVVPEAFPDWSEVMNTWGSLMLDAVKTLSEMVAEGCGLDANAFSSMMQYGPHLLAPTGSDLGNYDKLGTVFAGFHYDLNFLTIHGKSRYPGLYIWSRTGEKILVSVPKGCLLVQAGKQMEWLTGGYVMAGFHEVVVTPETLNAVETAKSENRPLWRVSSTLFSHIASDQILKPLNCELFQSKDSLQKYEPITAGKQVEKELESIKLKQ